MKCSVTQKFGQNFNPSYKKSGLLGHTGVDVVCGYGTPIECPVDGLVYKVLDNKTPSNDGTGFWGIFIIFEHKGQYKEFLVGHCSRIDIKKGDMVHKGQIIGLEGNRGQVFYGGIEITKAMQDAGDRRGSHRHYQTRGLKRMESSSNPCLTTTNPYGTYHDGQDFVYEVTNYWNGYNGCIDCQDILDEYDNWRMEQAIIHNTDSLPPENVIIIQRSFVEILKSYVNVLLTWIKLRK